MIFSSSLRQLLLSITLLCAPLAWGAWTKSSPPFDPKSISQSSGAFWICGANSSIAVSPDGGAKWEMRYSKEGGGTLLFIRWNSDSVGIAGGTGGLVLVTTDGGSHWQRVPTAISDPVLGGSFADEKHGIVVFTSTVMYTSDAGEHWSKVSPLSAEESAKFRFVLAVAALDDKHATVLFKEGPAQYYGQRLFSTADAGNTWKSTDLEHTTLNNLLVRQGKLWLVGTEVIHRESGGGYAVPVTFQSADGFDWERGPKPLIDTNTACRLEGCLMWNGAVFDPYDPNGDIHTFPKLDALSTEWAATPTRICALGPDLQCADTNEVKSMPERGGPAPQLAATELKASTAESAGKCIRCDYPHILISERFNGKATVKLTILARPDGTVSSVDVLSAPIPDIGSAMSKAARSWMFYPVLKDGVPVPTKRTLELTVMVIKSR